MLIRLLKKYFGLFQRRIPSVEDLDALYLPTTIDGPFCSLRWSSECDAQGRFVRSIPRPLREGGQVPDKRVMRLNLGSRGCIHVFEKADGSQYSIRIGSDAK